jgi:hypothetical protein
VYFLSLGHLVCAHMVKYVLNLFFVVMIILLGAVLIFIFLSSFLLFFCNIGFVCLL